MSTSSTEEKLNRIERVLVEVLRYLNPNEELTETMDWLRGAATNRRVVRREKTKADSLFDAMLNNHKSFWVVVYNPFMSRDIERATVRTVIQRGLEQTRGNYKMLLSLFNMPKGDYKRFLNFLRKHKCQVSFREVRAQFAIASADPSPPPPTPDPGPIADDSPPASPSPDPEPVADDSSPSPKPADPSPPPLPKPVPQPTAPSSGNGQGTTPDGSTQSWDLSMRVLAALFFSGGHRNVNLSRSELVDTLGDFLPADADIDVVVKNTFYHTKSQWGKLPKGNSEERLFIRQVAQFRREYGRASEIDDALSLAFRDDRSGDPVNIWTS
ncbi:MAG: hypothetical protein WAX80_00655 [Minisyncoccia bacterium]